jgi:hypothetical protein
MSHWAELDENNKVIRVTVGDNNDPAGDEGYQWLIDNLGGTWVKTSYNGTIRYNYAGIGYTYDPIDDAFIAPAPCKHKELILNVQKRWECSNASHVLIVGESGESNA